MINDPIGFLSYVRDDDAHEHGRLTEFCKLLRDEVRMQGCEEFEIFQDRNDIAWGQQWQQRIDNSIDATTFLVPIITPRFFKSPACRAEMERFLDREKRLKRNDLILPVYYIDSPVLNDEKKRKTDRLAMTIAERQYADWREIRFEPFTTPQLGKMLAKMAGQIIAAMERQQPPGKGATMRSKGAPRPRHKGAKTTRPVVGPSASTGSSEEAESSVQTPEMSRGPSAKTEPHTLIVDALHRGDHPTINAALVAAKPGDRILVRPGLYREGLVIDKPVEIIGDGALGEVVIEATESEVVLFKANMARIANLALRQAGGGKQFGIDITQGRLDLEGCDVTSQGLSCVAIHGGADPRLRRNRIHDGKQSGVYVFENGQGTLEDNDIFGNALSGVEIKEGGNPTLRRNRIHDGSQNGILVSDQGLGILEDNDISGNAYSGVEIRATGNATLRRNRIHDGKQVGVMVSDQGLGILEDNEIFGNAYSGIEIRTTGNPTLRRNRIYDGKAGGVYVHDQGMGVLENNEIIGNALTGVETKKAGNPTLRGNRIAGNAFEAVYVHDGGRGVFENNDLRGNSKGAWDIAKDCEKNVKRKGNLEDDVNSSKK